MKIFKLITIAVFCLLGVNVLAQTTETKVVKTLTPFEWLNVAIVNQDEVKGGLHSIADFSDVNDAVEVSFIPFERREIGMNVYDVATGVTYKLSNQVSTDNLTLANDVWVKIAQINQWDVAVTYQAGTPVMDGGKLFVARDAVVAGTATTVIASWYEVGGVGSVTTRELADNSVTTAKIVDSNVTSAKLADDITIAGDLTVTDNLLFDGGQAVDGIQTTIRATGAEDTKLVTEAAARTAIDALTDVEAGDAESQTLRWDNTNEEWVKSSNFTTDASGNITAEGTSTLKGDVTAEANLIVDGTTTANGNVSVTGTNTLTVGTGATDLGGTLNVDGDVTNNGNVTLGDAGTDNLTVNAATTANADVTITGANNLTVGTGATTLGGTLDVTGASTLTGNVTATNDLSVGGDVTTSGDVTLGAGADDAVTVDNTLGFTSADGDNTTINKISNDIALGGANTSDDVVSTQKAVKNYIDNLITSSDSITYLEGTYLALTGNAAPTGNVFPGGGLDIATGAYFAVIMPEAMGVPTFDVQGYVLTDGLLKSTFIVNGVLYQQWVIEMQVPASVSPKLLNVN